MPRASIKFTSDFLVEAFQRYRRQSRGTYVAVAIRVLAGLALAANAVVMFRDGQVFWGGFFAVLAVLMGFVQRFNNWALQRNARRSPYLNEDLSIEFSEPGFHVLSPKQDLKLRWEAFTRVVHFPDGFLLFQGPKLFNWIPNSSLDDPAQVAELAALLREKIAEHKVME